MARDSGKCTGGEWCGEGLPGVRDLSFACNARPLCGPPEAPSRHRFLEIHGRHEPALELHGLFVQGQQGLEEFRRGATVEEPRVVPPISAPSPDAGSNRGEMTLS